ncbi:hypothetical protein BX600DRAFT_435529 [Xylariales sp. PMI_506]|nr:hypothetical protein BX600DRAFT_435529 [Xylariales sp. PMI_506]
MTGAIGPRSHGHYGVNKWSGNVNWTKPCNKLSYPFLVSGCAAIGAVATGSTFSTASTAAASNTTFDSHTIAASSTVSASSTSSGLAPKNTGLVVGAFAAAGFVGAMGLL